MQSIKMYFSLAFKTIFWKLNSRIILHSKTVKLLNTPLKLRTRVQIKYTFPSLYTILHVLTYPVYITPMCTFCFQEEHAKRKVSKNATQLWSETLHVLKRKWQAKIGGGCILIIWIENYRRSNKKEFLIYNHIMSYIVYVFQFDRLHSSSRSLYSVC